MSNSSISIHCFVHGDSGQFGINHARLVHGIFTKHPGQEHEMQIGTVDDMTFEGGDSCDIDSYGYGGYGTEGSIEIWRGGKKVVKLSWEIPFGLFDGWNTTKSTVKKETWMSGYYDVDFQGFSSEKRPDAFDLKDYYSTNLKGKIGITIL